MNNRRPGYKNEAGYVLISSVLFSVMMLLFAVPFIFNLTNQYRTTDKSFKALVAKSLSEAGVERAIWELNKGDVSSWNGDDNFRSLILASVQDPQGKILGNITIQLKDPLTNNPIVEATGEIPIAFHLMYAEKTRVQLTRKNNALFNVGVFAKERLVISSNLFIDGDVGTNSTLPGAITVDSNTTINGDAVCGIGGDPETAIIIESNSYVLGEKKSASCEKEFPPAIQPEGLPDCGEFNISGETQFITTGGKYSSLNIGNNASVEICDDVILHVTGAFTMGSNSELNIQEGCSLTLYLSGSASFDSNSSLNNVLKDPRKLVIYGTDDFTDSVYFDSNLPVYAAIYMPQAELTFSSNVQFYGSVLADAIDLNSNVYVTYAEELAQLEGTPGSGAESDYVVKSWQQKTI